MISQTAEYALRTMVWLAGQPGHARTTSQIAEATQVPSGYLAKILQNLGKAGLVHSQRGINGGFTLAVSPEELSPLDIIQAIDPIRRIEQCPLGIEAHGGALCPLHRRLDEALAHVQRVLAETKIAELLTEATAGKPFCER